MEVKYRADLYTNYILIEIPEDADFQTYSFKMIEKNRIKGVLPSKIRMEDGKGYLYLDIDNRRCLVDIYKDKEMDLEEMTRIFQGLFLVMEELRNYLLSEKMILLDPQYIYEEDDGFCIVILPWKDEKPSFRKMAEFFLEKVNHKDENGVNAAYHFYRQQGQESFSLNQFMPVLEKENILKRQKKNKEIMPIPSPTTDWNVEAVEENQKEEKQGEEERKNQGSGMYTWLVLALLMMIVQFLNVIPSRIKI